MCTSLRRKGWIDLLFPSCSSFRPSSTGQIRSLRHLNWGNIESSCWAMIETIPSLWKSRLIRLLSFINTYLELCFRFQEIKGRLQFQHSCSRPGIIWQMKGARWRYCQDPWFLQINGTSTKHMFTVTADTSGLERRPEHLMAECVSSTTVRRIRVSLISSESPEEFNPNQSVRCAEMRRSASKLVRWRSGLKV